MNILGCTTKSLTGLTVFGISAGQAFGQLSYDPEAAVTAREAFIETMVTEHGFARDELTALLDSAEINETILDAISRPVERVVPWHEYREIFLTPTRMDRGAEFWLQHADIIGAAARRFGVDAAMIVAIIGVETLYGERMGSYRVLDALTTLAFAYPPRAAFFGSELESLFLLSREEGPGILDASGSYAGAMGAGQFIPSSFRAYAVDGDGDDRRDLWESWADIVASVANYLSEHGWREGDMVAEPATRGAAAGEPSNRLELTDTVGALRAAGYEFAANLSPSTPAAVIALERDDERLEYWVGYHNFFVITRYNRSLKYAMAAFQLSLEIRRLFETMSERAQ